MKIMPCANYTTHVVYLNLHRRYTVNTDDVLMLLDTVRGHLTLWYPYNACDVEGCSVDLLGID
jgi:hypothetical protein